MIDNNSTGKTPETEELKESEARTYVAHNYEAMNRAIDTQVDKQFELSELYRFQQTSRRTLMFMHITVSLCLILLSATVIWWLVTPVNRLPPPQINTTELKLSASSDRDTIDALKVISGVEDQQNNPEQVFINTSFTVFHRTLIPTGEYVVTGKTYRPENLHSPHEQYCYLEKSQSSEKLSGSPLAYVENKEIILETNEKELISFAKRHCQFSR